MPPKKSAKQPTTPSQYNLRYTPSRAARDRARDAEAANRLVAALEANQRREAEEAQRREAEAEEERLREAAIETIDTPSTPSSSSSSSSSSLSSWSAYSGSTRDSEISSNVPPTPSTPGTPTIRLPNVVQGLGLSDTPPETVWSWPLIFRREYHDLAVSRQLYLWSVLTAIRSWPVYSTLGLLLYMTYWRCVTYPMRMYARPAFICVLALTLYSILAYGKGWEWWLQLCTTDTTLFFAALLDTAMLVWLLLNLFDPYRGIMYTIRTPPRLYNQLASLAIRSVSVLRPVCIVAILFFGVVVRLKAFMEAEDWLQILYEVFNESLLISWVCGAVEIFTYWFVGFFAERRAPRYFMGRVEIGPVQRWEVECVIPWSTVVAAFYAVVYFGLCVQWVYQRGWFVFANE